MNSLEQFIASNRHQFEKEPAAGHFERLQAKIEHRASVQIKSYRWVAAAASLALLFAAGTVWKNRQQNDIATACNNAINLKLCYFDQMHSVATRIEKHTAALDPWARQDVIDCVQQIIDEADGDLFGQLPEELSEHETNAILADYYRQNLESLVTVEQRMFELNADN